MPEPDVAAAVESPSADQDGAALRRELEACRAALAALAQEQELLALALSHDVRAPLRSIDGFAALLARNPNLDPDATAQLERIRGASARLGTLVEALVELIRCERAPLAPTTVDLGLLAEWSLAGLQEADPGREVALEVAPHLFAHGDEHQLRRLLQVLLHNAWKFAPPEAGVRIRIEGAVADGRLRVRVHDAGIGFDMRYAGKLFTPLQRLHAHADGGGHGLGLALARRIVARHGGAIAAESTPGAGTTVTFDLPAADAAGPD